MTRAGLRALWSHWRRHPLQLFTLLAGLALATGLWSSVQAVNAEARASYDAAAATLGEGRYDALTPRVGDTIPIEQFVALRRAGWLVSPVLEGRLAVGGGTVRLVGLDPLTAPRGLGQLNAGDGASLADILAGRVLFAAPDAAALLDGAVAPRVLSDPAIAPGTAVGDISAVQGLLERPGAISRLVLAPEQPLGQPPLGTVAPDLVRQAAAGGSEIGRLTDSFHLNLTAFGFLSFAVGIFIVHGAIGLAFEQRRGMVRTMRAVGMPLRRVIVLFALELSLFALAGGLFGIVLGYLVAASLLPGVAATLDGLYGAQVAGTLQLRPAWWLSGFAMAFAGTALAATDALRRFARMPILAGGGARAWAMAAGRGRRPQGLVAVVLLAVAGALALAGGGLVTGFALLACLLFGAALALPLILDLVLAWLQHRAHAVKWNWFWADTRQQLPGLSLALMALLLAMAANVGVSTMVSSFRLTFTGFLDQRLVAELYVSANSPEQAAALEAFATQNARAVLPRLSVETRLAGLPAELFGARVGPSYSDNWQFLASGPGTWDAVAAGDAVIVNEQFARRAGLWVGDRLAVGPGTELPIAGVFGDYGNPIGQAIIGEELFRALFPDQPALRFGLRSDDAGALARGLEDAVGLTPGDIIDQAALKAFSMDVFERTFIVTGALNVLTLAVAGFAILTNLLTLSALRVPQLAPVWALGFTRRALGRLELLRAVVLALMTGLLALPLGLALAWVLLAIVNVAAFGWRLPMYLFPGDYLKLGLFALAAAVVAALWPARRLARTPPAHLLKVFANER